MKKQIFLVLLGTLACTQLSHAMQQAAQNAGRSARNKIRRVSMGPLGEEYSKATGAATLVRCTREQCEEETWMPGLLPALLSLVKKPENPGLFREFQQEYHANQNGQ